ncbi:hypothetical protein [Thermodesulfatator autotrophicus]|uniref:hypothetical protein n=1 Tax=Thermodesulfatator autotrophicus TaxID=1795632 RepID=UPI0012F7AA7C|nr:hypothetical protein [Thermodesulfatator autotrophicus]
MKFKDWLDLIPEEIVSRGKKLRKDVLELSRKDGQITARVKGSYNPYYQVKIKLSGSS